MKKLLALTLALAMALSLGVVSYAHADTDEDKLADAVFGTMSEYVHDGDTLKNSWFAMMDSPGDRFADADNDTVKSGATVYIILGNYGRIDMEKDVKIKIKKDDGSKYVNSVKLVEKKLDGKEGLVEPEMDEDGGYYGAGRYWVLEVKLKEFPTDDEYKISFELTATAKREFKSDEDDQYDLPKGVKITVHTEPIWVSNLVLDADQDFAAGTRGVVVKPQKNEENEITWENENDTLAWLTFTSDDDAKKFYPKLSTKWDDAEYAESFADQDAFLYDFIGNPQIASTSRATLRLRLPYVDEDGELSVDNESIVVYEVVDGELVPITQPGSIYLTEDDEWVFELKTRKLGTYIIAEKPITADEEAVEAPEEAEIPAEDAGEAPAEEPVAPVKAILPSFAK